MVRTGSDEPGRTMSISAPRLHARLLHQARIEQGMRVLEVGPAAVSRGVHRALKRRRPQAATSHSSRILP
ncbi:hypothetical protein E0H73_45400 [Kribbella pittospori]|uniref:Uncharacterized protein n=1 Tax=Kribbella pittospori TaxID=722689 RepID=A0A4V2M6R3_9ACTN|nr:hypothetical protein E0H73_45400 [Kribbella pittospori]